MSKWLWKPEEIDLDVFLANDDVKTLYHSGDIHTGTVSWNLKTKENLDIAYGVYFYVIESDAGTKQGKIGIIK